METRAHYVLVGIFTLMAAMAALLFTLWMSGSGMAGDSNRYDILFLEPVSGLTPGSPVHYSGIPVGEVEDLTLDRQDPRQVWARITVSSTAPVKVDTQARLRLLNVTGAYAIELSHGLPESPLLSAGDGRIPVIAAEPSPIALLRLNSDELMTGFTTFMDSANRLISSDNLEHLTQILSNLDSLTTRLAEQQHHVAEGLESLALTGVSLSSMSARLDEQSARYAGPIMSNVLETTSNLQEFSALLNAIVTDNRQALDSGLQGVAEMGPAMQDLRATLATLRAIADRLEDDPGRFILGRDQIREYRP
jgi:phospholipid/cholesterol/gamma-HCH transport system substrate-binding protein